MYKILSFFGVIIPPGLLTFLILFFPEKFQYILKGSMPYRGMFLPKTEVIGALQEPNILGISIFYLLPLLYGVILGGLFHKTINISKSPIVTLCSMSLFFSLLFILPINLFIPIDSIEILLSIGYLYLLIPVLVLFGIVLVNFTNINCNLKINSNNKSVLPYIIFVIIISLYIFFKLYIAGFSKYPIGFDVYYHTALSMNIVQGNGISQSPIFFESYNMYPPLMHYIVAKLSLITRNDIFTVWITLDTIVLTLFLFSLFFFVRHITQNNTIALISVIFILPWDQFWSEISSRRLALVFIPFYLALLFDTLKKRKFIHYLALASLLIIISASHHLLTVITAIQTIFLLFLGRYFSSISIWIVKVLEAVNIWFSKLLNSVSYNNAPILNFSNKGFLSLIGIYVISLMYFVSIGTAHYPINKTLLFNEIALSLFRPFGIITLMPFILTIAGLPLIFRQIDNKLYILICSFFVLYLPVFFYITKVGILYPDIGVPYSRMFAEIGYIGFAIFGSIVLYNLLLGLSKRHKIMISVILILLFAWSIYPAFVYNSWYGDEIDRRIDRYIDVLQEVNTLPSDSVILTDPEDMINRYIPGISGKYIFAVRYFITDEKPYHIISPTLNKFVAEDMEKRYLLSINFLNDPKDESKLNQILQSYRVTHLLLTQEFYNNYNLENDERFKTLAKKNRYVLLELL